jgi:hypothetical protein
MATSTNYGWAEPDNSSLVKNGASDIRTLGNAIDSFLFRPFTRNVIINGGFDNFQRGTSSSTSGWTCADRWYNIASGTTTFSQDTSVPTAHGVQYSYKWTTGAASSYGQYYTALESATVKPLRGQAMVFSFWVKTTGTAITGTLAADAAYSTSTDAYASQTVAVSITGASGITPTATWTKYSGTLTIPSDASGLKIGLIPTSVQASGVVVYLAACQLEVGSTATPFNRAGGTIQGELAACQRYYYRNTQTTSGVPVTNNGGTVTTTLADVTTKLPVTMRVSPVTLETLSLGWFNFLNATVYSSGTFVATVATPDYVTIRYTHGTVIFTAGTAGVVVSNANPSYIGFSAEL